MGGGDLPSVSEDGADYNLCQVSITVCVPDGEIYHISVQLEMKVFSNYKRDAEFSVFINEVQSFYCSQAVCEVSVYKRIQNIW